MNDKHEASQKAQSGPSFRLAAFFTLWPAILGIAFAQFLLGLGFIGNGNATLVTLVLFVAQDYSGAVLFGVAVLAALLLARKTNFQKLLDLDAARSNRAIAVMAFVGALAAWGTARLVFHGYGLSLDEYLPMFQAEILRHGQLLAPLSPDVMPFHKYLQPIFTYTDEARGLWASQYRPGHAILLALMPSLGGINLLNALLTAISVFALASITRRLWPERAEMPILAVALFLVSPQVLVTAGAGFSYPAHLAFNLVWLALFLKGVYEDRLSAHIAAALVGAYAIGLHQVHVHPLFAAPFLALLLIGSLGRRVHLLPYIVLYAIFLPIWVLWPELGVWVTTGDTSALPRHLAEVNYLADFLRYSSGVDHSEAPYRRFFLVANLLRYALWLSPAVILLSIAALLRPSRLGAVVWAALASTALTIVANHVLMPNQMLTWGARYYHPVIGNMILLALSGYVVLREAKDDPVARRVIEVAVLLIFASAALLLPQRMLQVNEKVAPRAAVQKSIDAIDADVVVIKNLPIWFSLDFVRNSPYLTNRPIILFLWGDKPIPKPDELPGPMKGARIHVLTAQELTDFGLPSGTLYEPAR